MSALSCPTCPTTRSGPGLAPVDAAPPPRFPFSRDEGVASTIGIPDGCSMPMTAHDLPAGENANEVVDET
jgi:hypothetical protein